MTITSICKNFYLKYFHPISKLTPDIPWLMFLPMLKPPGSRHIGNIYPPPRKFTYPLKRDISSLTVISKLETVLNVFFWLGGFSTKSLRMFHTVSRKKHIEISSKCISFYKERVFSNFHAFWEKCSERRCARVKDVDTLVNEKKKLLWTQLYKRHDAHSLWLLLLQGETSEIR